jgi:hypothetical protein
MEGAHTSMFLAIVVLCDPIGSFKFSIASIIMPSSLQESHRIKVKHCIWFSMIAEINAIKTNARCALDFHIYNYLD